MDAFSNGFYSELTKLALPEDLVKKKKQRKLRRVKDGASDAALGAKRRNASDAVNEAYKKGRASKIGVGDVAKGVALAPVGAAYVAGRGAEKAVGAGGHILDHGGRAVSKAGKFTKEHPVLAGLGGAAALLLRRRSKIPF